MAAPLDPTLACIVCTYRRADSLNRLLRGVAGQTVPPDEVLIVDGSPDAETERIVTAQQSTWSAGALRYFRVPPEDRGLTRQRNFALARTRSSLLAFLDDDTVPDTNYFETIRHAFGRHPDAAGVGGYIRGTAWERDDAAPSGRVGVFSFRGWRRREDYRWRLRKVLRLTSPLAPGWMPPSGHGRPVSFLPPDGDDYRVEFMMGGASAWRRDVFDRHRFSQDFEGYGLYEDLDFCLRVSADRPLFLCTAATLAHYHDDAARPSAFRYGEMVVRNGWKVWRLRWPQPAVADRARWWAITILLMTCRLGDALRGPGRRAALADAIGRGWAMISTSVLLPERT